MRSCFLRSSATCLVEAQTVKLLDSIMRGYPVGIVLLWETYNDIQFRDFAKDYRSGSLPSFRDNADKRRSGSFSTGSSASNRSTSRFSDSETAGRCT